MAGGQNLYANARGYLAELVYHDAERVLYHVWDEDRRQISENYARSAAGFFREWSPVSAKRAGR